MRHSQTGCPAAKVVAFLDWRLHRIFGASHPSGDIQAVKLLPVGDPVRSPADRTLPAHAVGYTNKMLSKVQFFAMRWIIPLKLISEIICHPCVGLRRANGPSLFHGLNRWTGSVSGGGRVDEFSGAEGVADVGEGGDVGGGIGLENDEVGVVAGGDTAAVGARVEAGGGGGGERGEDLREGHASALHEGELFGGVVVV